MQKNENEAWFWRNGVVNSATKVNKENTSFRIFPLLKKTRVGTQVKLKGF